MDQSRRPETQLQLPPGFRFHPTDEELVVHYLAKRSEGKSAHPFGVPIIAELDLYKYNPWDLPALAYVGEKEWYFLTPRDRKYPNGARPNRAAASGFWKATGTDKPIHEKGSGTKVGVKKALVFYEGKAPKGVKTNWIMHEYRLAKTSEKAHNPPAARNGSLRMDDWVLCRIYKKSSAAFKTASSALVPKTEATEDSSIHDVLDSLPDIEDSRAASSEMDSFDSFISDDLEPFGEQSQLGSGNENATEQCQYRSTEENSDGAQSGAVQQYPMMDYLVDCFEEQGSRADPDSWFSELFSPATAAAAQESVQRRNHGLKRMHQEDLQDQGLQSIRKLARLDANDEKGWASYGSLIRII